MSNPSEEWPGGLLVLVCLRKSVKTESPCLRLSFTHAHPDKSCRSLIYFTLGPAGLAGLMYQLDQALPTWTAALEPVGLLWKNNSSICEPSQQDSAHAHTSLLTSQLSAAPVGTNAAWPDSSRGPESGQVQLGAATKQHQMWEPVPVAPDDFRDEVLNLFSANSEGTAPEPEPTKQEFTHSAPSSSGFTNGTEKDCSKQLDSSAISRTRSQPNTSEQKQANARESQKRFRARQKVCKCADEQHVCMRLGIMRSPLHFPDAELDAT